MKKLMVSTLVVLAALMVSLVAVSMASADHPAGPAGYWPADGDADDSTSHSNNGSLVGSAGFGTGKLNAAFAFHSQGDGVRVPASASLNITEELTAAAWIKPTKKNW